MKNKHNTEQDETVTTAETNNKTEAIDVDTQDSTIITDDAVELSIQEQLDNALNANESMKKDYLFLMAEFDNFKKRTLKEKSELLKNAAETTLKGLLPIVDDFERGLDAIKDSSDASSVKEGMELIYNKLIKYLATNGVKAIESTGSDFDPDFHEAIAMIPASDDTQRGKIIDTVEKGYTLNDKVIRHAKVAVGQ